MSFAVIGGGVAAAATGAVLSSVMGGPSSSSQAAASAADPFASQRSQYQTQLSQLMANPSSVTSTPGYQFNMQQGLNSVQAGNAAKGIGTSGANAAAEETFASGLANSTYQQDVSNLSILSGATTGSPAAAGTAITAGNAATAAGISSISGAVGTAVNNLKNPLSTIPPGTSIDTAYGNTTGSQGESTNPLANYSNAYAPANGKTL